MNYSIQASFGNKFVVNHVVPVCNGQLTYDNERLSVISIVVAYWYPILQDLSPRAATKNDLPHPQAPVINTGMPFLIIAVR
jgi:hypothetical protein